MKKCVEMKNITKSFSRVIANENVNFDLYESETHVLLGENGAGKTTLMNVLYGLYQPDNGEILFKGKKCNIKSPNDAIKLGIGMVHQHFMLVHNLTVTQNIILGHEPKNGLNVNYELARKKVNQIASEYGFDIDPDEVIENMSVGRQQKVEILKALYRGAEILILDEPTAVLTPQEVIELGKIIENLKKQGKSIIMITHKLKEVMSMSDRITVLRRGKVTGVVKTSDVQIEKLIEMMIGENIDFKIKKEPSKLGDVIIKVEDLVVKDYRESTVVDNLNLEIYSGEILGLAGVDGNGQSEFAEALVGLAKTSSGKIMYKGKDISKASVRERIKMGISNVPEDRHKRGLILNFSLYENSILGVHDDKRFLKGCVIDYTKVRQFCTSLIKEFDVRTPGISLEAKKLSGGNQQKLVVARELAKNPDFLLASQPTRGVDIGAIDNIHKRLIKERDKGKAVLLISSELDEILALSDRIAVIYKGKIVSTLPISEANEQKLGILMAGGQVDGGD